MSKNKRLLVVAVALVMAYTLLIVLAGLKNVWFSLALCFIGCYSLVYSCFYHLDSHLYLGTILVLWGGLLALDYYKYLEGFTIWGLATSVFAIAHLTVFLVFRQNIHFKIFTMLAIISIILLSYKINILPFWGVVAMLAVMAILLAIQLFKRLRRNLRRR